MSATVTANMDSYMRDQCDIFLRGLEVKLMAQVSTMISTIKLEMYKEMGKTANSMVDKFLVNPRVSYVATGMSGQSEGFSPCSVDLLHSTDPDLLDTDTFFDAADVPSDSAGDLVLPKRQIKKIKRRERRENTRKLYSEGTSSVSSSPGFSGKVPYMFMYRCSKDSKADIIKDDLTARGIKVKSVVRKSHVDAEASSFKIAVEGYSDYEKLLSGKHLPKFVKVKQYIYYSDYKRSRNVRTPSFVNQPYSSSSPISSTGNDTHDSVKICYSPTNDISQSNKQISPPREDLYMRKYIRDLS